MMRSPLRLIAALAAVSCLLPIATAGAADGMETILEDEFELLQRDDDARRRALDDFVALGADTVRSLVLWNQVAPDPGNTRRPRGFDGSNPAAYPPHLWDRYDDIVRGTAIRGLDLILTPSSPIPFWGSDCKGRAKRGRNCKPDVKLFGNFVQALGRRYSGGYADENQGGGVLPRVDRWSVFNEPNQPGWLQPQYEVRNGRRVAAAAHRYRSLVRAATAALRRSGHGSDQIMLGETAPIGRTSGSLSRRPIPPVEFIRELLCLKRNGRKQTGSAARAVGCTRYARLAVNAFAHHPYTRGGSQPPRARVLPGEITISTAGRLKKLLSQGARAKRIPSRLPILYTEFGYQTNPPDRLFGVTLEEQGQYLNESDYIAFRDSRVKSVAQYKLIDEPDQASFQTGLRFIDGTPKPAFDYYRLPLWVVKRGDGARVYGQVRPARDGAHERVEVQNGTGGSFSTVLTVDVRSSKGHFLVDVPAATGDQWRLRWAPSAGGPVLFSRVAKAAPRGGGGGLQRLSRWRSRSSAVR